MWPDVTIDVEVGPVLAIPIPPTVVDVVALTGDAYLVGWNFREVSGEVPAENEGSVTSPAANTTLLTISGLAAGTYTVKWQVELSGTVAAADANNFKVQQGGTFVVGSINQGAVGNFPQDDFEMVLVAGNNVTVRSVAAGTVGAVYSAQLSLIPVDSTDAIVEVQDGNQPLGESSMGNGRSDDRWFGPQGVKVHQQILVHIVQGTITGVVYARFIK